MPKLFPERCTRFYGDDGAVLGHLVIDSSVNGVSGGGIRMVPEMATADLCHLARAMTLKYGFLKWPFGGAKAVILTHRDALSLEERQRYVRAFAKQLKPSVGRYLPGEDAGTNDDDLHLICKTSGLMRQRSIPDSGYFTAMTARICTEQVAAQQRIPLDSCRVAIEGFGKVGALGLTHARTMEIMHQVFAPKVETLMAQTQTTDEPLEDIARQIAMANHKAMKQAADHRPHGLFSGIIKVARRGLMPAPLKRVFGPIYLKKTMA